MESPSAPAHRGLVPWQELLLAGSLLIFWSLPITQEVTVWDFNAGEGDDALLEAKGVPPVVVSYSWFQGASADDENFVIGSYLVGNRTSMSGPKNNSREIICANGSLLFLKTTKQDAGFYTLQVIVQASQFERATGQLRVFSKLSKPTLKTENTSPEENKDPLVFKCEPFTPNTTYRFVFNNKTHPLSSPEKNTLTLDKVLRKDAGTYECETANPIGAHCSNSITLNVLYGPEKPIIIPHDFEYSSGTTITLACSAVSNPPAEISWIINGKTRQKTPDLIIPQITEKDSGTYICHARNPATGFNRTRVRKITVISASSSLGINIGIKIGVLVGLAVITALVF